MSLITITETGRFTDQPNATVSFDHGAPQPITATDPFRDGEEERLRWYFEEHLRFPFAHGVRASQAVRSIVTYGEALFAQVCQGQPDLYARYQAAARRGLHTLHFDIVGSPAFHQLHWEALCEPGRDPFVLHAAMGRRSTANVQGQREVKESPTINLLVVTACPHGRRDVGYRTISRPLIEGLRQVQAPVRVDIVRPWTYRALVEWIRRGPYQSLEDAATADVWPCAFGSPGPPLPVDTPRASSPACQAPGAGPSPGHRAGHGGHAPRERGVILTPAGAPASSQRSASIRPALTSAP